MPENVGKNRKTLKSEVKIKKFNETVRRTSSKIPRPSTPVNRNIEDHPLAYVEDDQAMADNQVDSSFLQLYITKVYLIQDALNKKKVTINSDNPNLNHNVLELAEKITKLCHKINDVESHMYIGSKNAVPKFEFGPGGDIDVIESNGSKYLGKIFENAHFKDDNQKSTKNALNTTTSQLFSPSDFSISNMFNSTNIQKTSFLPENNGYNKIKPDPEVKTETICSIDKSVGKTLDVLVNKTDDIMGRISLIELNIKKLSAFNEASQTNEICDYCKIFSDELSNQKGQIKHIVDTLQEFIEQFSNIPNYQEEFNKISSTMQNVLHNTEELRFNVNVSSKNSVKQNSVVLNKNDRILKKNYSELISRPNEHYCLQTDLQTELQTQVQNDAKTFPKNDFCFVDKERYKLFKKFLKKHKRAQKKPKKKVCAPPENSNDQSIVSNLDGKNFIGKVCSMCSISSKKSEISNNKNKNLTKNISSDKNNLNSRSFRNLNISESLKLNEDCRITENEIQSDVNTSSQKIIWNNQMKNSEKILKGIVHKNSSQTTENGDKYSEIVMELNTIISNKKTTPDVKNKTLPTKKVFYSTSNEKNSKRPSDAVNKLKKSKSIFSFTKKNSKCIQVPSNIINDSQQLPNLCKFTGDFNDITKQLLEKSVLCRLCGCKTNNTFNLNSKSSVANYLCQLLNNSLKCETCSSLVNNDNCIRINVPLDDQKDNKDTLQELFVQKSVSSRSLLLNPEPKHISKEKHCLEPKDSSQISLKHVHKTFDDKKLYKYFIKSKYVNDENSNSGIVKYDSQENTYSFRRRPKFSMFPSKCNTKVFGHTPKGNSPNKDANKIKLVGNKCFANAHIWGTDTQLGENSYVEYIDPCKHHNVNIIYKPEREPYRLKSFGYESVSLFEQPLKESEITKQRVKLEDILNNKSSRKSIYTSSSLNDYIKNSSPIKYTNSDVKKLLQKPKKTEDGKYILCISNKVSDIQKLETMGLKPIEINRRLLNSEKKFLNLSTKDVNLIDKNQYKNEFIKPNFTNNPFLSTEFQTVTEQNVKELFGTSDENDIDIKSEYDNNNNQLNSKRKILNIKKSFFRRLLGKMRK